MNSLSQKAQDLIKVEGLDEAYSLIQKSLKDERTAESCLALAEISFLKKNYNDSIYYYEEVIKISPSAHHAYGRIAEILLLNGHPLEALNYFGLAMKADPNALVYKQGFIGLVSRLKLQAFNANVKELVLLCLETPDLDSSRLGFVWQGLLRFDPASKDFYKAISKDTYDDFSKAFSRLKDYKTLTSKFFLEGLRGVIVFDPVFERSLSYLRRYALEELKNNIDYLPFIEALSYYCLVTEYVLYVSDSEKEQLAEIKDNAAILSCYSLLHSDDNAAKLKALLPESMIEAHFTEFEKQRDIRHSIPAMNIEDNISSKVRAQYEEFPYPRWRHYPSVVKSQKGEGFLNQGTPQVLVAGCGTGAEAVELSKLFPNAEILAVDLSLTSLSYGIMKAQNLGIKNIDFRQADILKLRELDRKFDFIASTGVLHHMNDPDAGMSVLNDLLNPGGTMRIALYSELARQEIVAAREVIAREGYNSDSDGIRRFRHEAKSLLRIHTYADITDFADYYYLSECRDLLFHVQEHRFDMGQLESFLGKFDMRLIEFYLPEDVRAQYRKQFPDDPAMTSFSNWAVYEKQNPRTFREMYRFWARKPI